MIVYLGAVAPEALRVTITPATSGVDLSTVSAATIEVLKPSGAKASWTTSLSAQSAGTLTITHAFALADIDVPGTWKFLAKLTVPGGSVRTVPARFEVSDPFAVA